MEEAGAAQWLPRCEDPWTGRRWREGLQALAGAVLGTDPSTVREKIITSHFLSNMSSAKTYVQRLDKLHYQWNKEIYHIRVLCNSTRVSNPDNKWEVRCQKIVSSVPRKLYWFCQKLWVELGVTDTIPEWTNFCILPEILSTLEKHLMGGQWDYIEFVRNAQRFLEKIDETCLCYDCKADIWNYTFDRETSSFRHSAHFWWYYIKI